MCQYVVVTFCGGSGGIVFMFSLGWVVDGWTCWGSLRSPATYGGYRQKMEKPENRQFYGKRQGMVEPVFSQLKCRQGLRRFRRKGLKAVRCEFALHAMAYNLSRACVRSIQQQL
ncbi:MAG: transposase [Candidatus Thiodiazotropha sp.]